MLLITFLLVALFAAYAAWQLWSGSRVGGPVSLMLLPVEALFWYGFALPFPWLIGLLRAALIASAWPSLGSRGSWRRRAFVPTSDETSP